MEVELAKLVLGTLYALTTAMLKLKNLPASDRKQLEVAKVGLEKEMGELTEFEGMAKPFRRVLEWLSNGGKNDA